MGVAKAALFLFGHVLTFQIRKRSRGPLARTHKEVTKFTKEEKHEYRSGRAAALAEAYGSSRIGLIVEM